MPDRIYLRFLSASGSPKRFERSQDDIFPSTIRSFQKVTHRMAG